MSGLQARYMSICGAFCITPDTAGVTDLNPQNMPLRSAWFSGTVTANAFAGTGGGATFTSLTVAQGTIVAAAVGITQTVTWNNAAVTFVAQDLNVTDTASNATSILAQWRVGGASKVNITKSGSMTLAGSITIGQAATFNWSTRSFLRCSADGQLNVTNNANTGFARLTLGLETALFPSLKVNGAILQVRLGDDSDFTSTSVANVQINKAAAAVAAGQIGLGSTHQTTVGAAGAASALPAQPTGYWIVNVEGTLMVVPYYAQA